MPKTRIYVSLGAIAKAIGIPSQQIHTVHRPDSWGVPGDWKMDGASTLYCVDSLPSLARALESDGFSEAAALLRAAYIDRPSEDTHWYQRGVMA